ncbi:DUF1629 domain-containing protein [Mesorhizobium sp. M4A.F.Ca.ET.020.02.1.1]|uniref:imm11 family protein n=1 Tax=Mesorhizobium sp. M4A.F.Ca.ET.020.02.1.1 TaxID=2496652 RepID=UPI001AEC92FF|nr:DUF1629 domain-containing protein [Mesorhizobium sp. M4A.F.Ca.ET.020.02.1.1]
MTDEAFHERLTCQLRRKHALAERISNATVYDIIEYFFHGYTGRSSMKAAENTKTTFPRQVGKSRRFFKFDSDLRGGKGHGVRIANEDALITPGLIVFAPPPAKGHGFAELPEKPQLVHYPKEGKMPRDLEILHGYLIVSERLKRVFEDVDAAGFEFVDCDFTLADGSQGPKYYLADVVRVLDAIDEARRK